MQMLPDRWQTNTMQHLYFGGACDVDVLRVKNGEHEFGACLSPIGAPSATALLEELTVLGFQRFVVFGTCGILVPGIAAGSLIVPTAAVRDEGTSYHYAPASDTIPLVTAARLADYLDDMRVPYVKGTVWTTDAFYRETRALVNRRVAEGCVAVDMEASALAAMSQFRGVDVYQFLVAADWLGNEWVLRSLADEPRVALWEIAFAIARRLEDGTEERHSGLDEQGATNLSDMPQP